MFADEHSNGKDAVILKLNKSLYGLVQAPLSDDTEEYLQSSVILRYAGMIARLTGGDAAKLYLAQHAGMALAIDEALDIVQDAGVSKCPQHADNDTRKKLREEYAEGKCKVYCQHLSDLVEKSGGPFLTGADMPIADLQCVFSLF
jgi:hypothetical protein